MKVRIEMPVLLYVDVEVTAADIAQAKPHLWAWLGEPGAEDGASVPCSHPLSHARIYPSDHASINSEANLEIVDVMPEGQ